MCKSVMLCAVPMPVDSKEACTHTASAQTHFSSLPAVCLDVLNKSVRECLIPVGLDGLPLQLNVQPLNFLSSQNNTLCLELVTAQLHLTGLCKLWYSAAEMTQWEGL